MTGTQSKTTHSRELYIDGKWQPQSGTGSIDVLSASTEEIIGSVPEGTAADVDRAARAGRTAFDNGWSQTTVQERAAWLLKLAGALKERAEQIANNLHQKDRPPLSMST